MKPAGVIIAGGRSSRMGRDKAFAEVSGIPIIWWIIKRIAPQVEVLAVNCNGTHLSSLGLPVIADHRTGIGTPLAGLHAALLWARHAGHGSVLTVPADSPFLPLDLCQRLAGPHAAIAASGGQSHYLTGLWPTGLLEMLEAALENGLRRVQDWASLCGAQQVDWPVKRFDPFFNVNSPEDLASAQEMAASQGLLPESPGRSVPLRGSEPA